MLRACERCSRSNEMQGYRKQFVAVVIQLWDRNAPGRCPSCVVDCGLELLDDDFAKRLAAAAAVRCRIRRWIKEITLMRVVLTRLRLGTVWAHVDTERPTT